MPLFMKSVLTSEPISLANWVTEMHNLSYSNQDIAKYLEGYELQLALIVKCYDTFYCCPEFRIWADELLGDGQALLMRYPPQSSGYRAIKYMLAVAEEHNFGVSQNRVMTHTYYSLLSELIEYCFYIPKEYSRERLAKVNYYRFRNRLDRNHLRAIVFSIGTKMIDLDFNDIKEVIFFIKRKKIELSNNTLASPQEKTCDSVQNQMLNNFSYRIVNPKLIKQISWQLSIIENKQDQIISLIDKKAMEISSEILRFYKDLPDEVKKLNLPPEKLWMLARHPKMQTSIPRLAKIKNEKGENYVTEGDKFYIWNGSISILTYYLKNDAGLEIKNYSKGEWEPFAVAFNCPNIWDNARKHLLEPLGYVEFIKKLKNFAD